MRGSGRIEVIQGNARLRGDNVAIDLASGVAEIEGDVVATYLGDIVTGSKGVYDFEKEEGVFYTARGSSEPWYVSTDKVEREASGQYTVDTSTLSTCDLPNPHYRLEAGGQPSFPRTGSLRAISSCTQGAFLCFTCRIIRIGLIRDARR